MPWCQSDSVRSKIKKKKINHKNINLIIHYIYRRGYSSECVFVRFRKREDPPPALLLQLSTVLNK